MSSTTSTATTSTEQCAVVASEADEAPLSLASGNTLTQTCEDVASTQVPAQASSHRFGTSGKAKEFWKLVRNAVKWILAAVGCAAGISAFVTVRPTHESAVDGSKSLALSWWTAKKEYYVFCEEHDWTPPDCVTAKDTPPRPPPDVRARSLQNPINTTGETSVHSTVVMLVAMSFVAWLLVLAKRRRGLLRRRPMGYTRQRLHSGSDSTPKSSDQPFMKSPESLGASRISSGSSTGVSSGLAQVGHLTTGGGLRQRKASNPTDRLVEMALEVVSDLPMPSKYGVVPRDTFKSKEKVPAKVRVSMFPSMCFTDHVDAEWLFVFWEATESYNEFLKFTDYFTVLPGNLTDHHSHSGNTTELLSRLTNAMDYINGHGNPTDRFSSLRDLTDWHSRLEDRTPLQMHSVVGVYRLPLPSLSLSGEILQHYYNTAPSTALTLQNIGYIVLGWRSMFVMLRRSRRADASVQRICRLSEKVCESDSTGQRYLTGQELVFTREKYGSLIRAMGLVASLYKVLGESRAAHTRLNPFPPEDWVSLVAWRFVEGFCSKARLGVINMGQRMGGIDPECVVGQHQRACVSQVKALRELQVELSSLSRDEARYLWDAMRYAETRKAVLVGKIYQDQGQ